MGDILINQTIAFRAAKNPSQGAVTETEFNLQAETLAITAYSISSSGRFALLAAAAAVPLGMNGITTASVLVLKPEDDVQVKLTNALGSSQLLTFKAGTTSLIYCDFTEIELTNPSATEAAKGSFYFAGV
jgi:large exoprotein involved in heme utilization and adhesion